MSGISDLRSSDLIADLELLRFNAPNHDFHSGSIRFSGRFKMRRSCNHQYRF